MTRTRRNEHPDLVVTSDPDTFIRIGAAMTSPFHAIAASQVSIDGSADAVMRCTRMLGLS